MKEDHDKLIAKIQHFHDHLQSELAITSNLLIEDPVNVLNIGKEDVLNSLINNHQQIFHDFLYTE